jgi:hypothetical protein
LTILAGAAQTLLPAFATCDGAAAARDRTHQPAKITDDATARPLAQLGRVPGAGRLAPQRHRFKQAPVNLRQGGHRTLGCPQRDLGGLVPAPAKDSGDRVLAVGTKVVRFVRDERSVPGGVPTARCPRDQPVAHPRRHRTAAALAFALGFSGAVHAANFEIQVVNARGKPEPGFRPEIVRNVAGDHKAALIRWQAPDFKVRREELFQTAKPACRSVWRVTKLADDSVRWIFNERTTNLYRPGCYPPWVEHQQP